MDQEILDILEEEAAWYSQMLEVYNTRLEGYGELRQSLQELLEDYSEEEEMTEDERDDRLNDLMNIREEVQSRLPEGLPEAGVKDASALTLGIHDLFTKIDEAGAAADRAHMAEWVAQIKGALNGYLDFVDAAIADVEADRDRLEASRLRFNALRLMLTQSGE